MLFEFKGEEYQWTFNAPNPEIAESICTNILLWEKVNKSFDPTAETKKANGFNPKIGIWKATGKRFVKTPP